jgi:ABC-type Fe2+-enterobactin transport system substrate-binding protein
MKRFTHPILSYTFIRFKDGSSYSKHWRYLRPTLILEGDQKNWEERSLQTGYMPGKPRKTASHLQHFPKNFFQTTDLKANNRSFWV